jgi:hypothetical protein
VTDTQPARLEAGAEAAVSAPAPVLDEVVQLASDVYPEGVADEAAYEAYNAERVADMVSAAAGADEPLVEVEHRLAAANWILSYRIEPQVSRLLLGIQRSDDLTSLRALAGEAQAQLETCRAILDALNRDVEGAPDAAGQGKPTADLRRIQKDLSAFAEAVVLAWSPDPGEDYEQRARRCASSLGVLLEHGRPGVAAAAALYQALLYTRAERVDRALAVLDLAFEPPPREDRPVVFFNRLLRCHCLSQRGDFATAWSLLLRLEERAYEWFDQPGAGERAARTAVLLRLAVTRRWRARLLAEDKDEEAAWCQEAAQQIIETLRESDKPVDVMRASPAVPFLLEGYALPAD